MENKRLYPGQMLHKLGPYIGKMRPQLARELISQYTQEGNWIWDPFCGSGTVPLESQLLSRNVIASDVNPYACLLTRAKLHAPRLKQVSLSQLDTVTKEISERRSRVSQDIPNWVKKFFHPKTLEEIDFLSSRFVAKKHYFNLGCLLGILHHQRPGFLSYPASHLVPYLRDKNFPRELYPELYKYRDPIKRMELKIIRMLEYPPPPRKTRFTVFQKSAQQKYLADNSIDAVITSPPYMDALDYSRDNRLRLWFLGINDYKSIRKMEIFRIRTFKQDMERALNLISNCLKNDAPCILVLGDVQRKNNYNVPQMIIDIVREKIENLTFEEQSFDCVPDSRRSRREGKATKKESTVIFRRKKRN